MSTQTKVMKVVNHSAVLPPKPSDRNLKTAVEPVRPEAVLAVLPPKPSDRNLKTAVEPVRPEAVLSAISWAK